MKVLYYQLMYAFQKEHSDTNVAATGTLTLLDDSFLSADSFLQHLCKVFSSLFGFYTIFGKFSYYKLVLAKWRDIWFVVYLFYILLQEFFLLVLEAPFVDGDLLAWVSILEVDLSLKWDLHV